jgi:hypothetical protein
MNLGRIIQAHSLTDDLEQKLIEKIAHILCNGEKREYTSGKLGNLHITKTQQDHITTIMTNLSTTKTKPDLAYEDSLLFQDYDTPLMSAIDFSADVFYEDDDSVVAIELKTVKPNSGIMMGEKQKMLEGKAALYRLFPHKKICFYIGFPFDPTVNPDIEPPTSYNKDRFFDSIINIRKFCDEKELLLAAELWDFLSGHTETMEDIVRIINTISTPSFLDKFRLLVDPNKRTSAEYMEQLREWNLVSETRLIENNTRIRARITDKQMLKVYNKSCFDNGGTYNWERYTLLNGLISE